MGRKMNFIGEKVRITDNGFRQVNRSCQAQHCNVCPVRDACNKSKGNNILLTKEKEFQNFRNNQNDNLKDNFIEAKSSLMSDLLHYCNEYREPDRDSPNNKKTRTEPGFPFKNFVSCCILMFFMGGVAILQRKIPVLL